MFWGVVAWVPSCSRCGLPSGTKNCVKRLVVGFAFALDGDNTSSRELRRPSFCPWKKHVNHRRTAPGRTRQCSVFGSGVLPAVASFVVYYTIGMWENIWCTDPFALLLGFLLVWSPTSELNIGFPCLDAKSGVFVGQRLLWGWGC